MSCPETLVLTRYEFGGSAKAKLSITNIHQTKNTAFKIKTTLPSIFVCKPTTGILIPGQTIACRIQMLVNQYRDKEVMKNKFMIQSALTEM